MGPIRFVFLLVLMVAVIAAVVFVERAARRVVVQYARRMVGRRMYGGQSTHIPLKVNTGGVMPVIFASSILSLPMMFKPMFTPNGAVDRAITQLGMGYPLYNLLYVTMIIFFAFFYTAIQFQPVQVADNLKKQNAFIPGIRPGKATADFIDTVMTRITVAGALYMAAVCTVPDFLQQAFRVPFYFGGTSIMIVVGVALDLVQQIESHLITRHYEGLTGSGGPRIRGRRG
jgi:preprotein translocase subunit SecY